ncbi:D-2-hydroxyacid dehydrogenase [Rheinheimera sp. 4Y26]|uniref:D-2-hydroxyacid dehydrogenase n=1 Tax=Rheinheimera sp. 4Y26 TaxID=2977811 RepID=UPI0021B0C70A|nr:D-2-hydroxyacid dehydrogenase [Rheinheimera sp. 4Y26]MCT6698487.1 D-2-hydroxyacid dehydrogenase [Rheinheimera sp. 4Y26]
MHKMVFLDAASLPGVDLTPLQQPGFELQSYPHSNSSELAGRLAGATVAIVNKVVLDAPMLAALPDLKLICVTATGINNIDLAAACRAGISVCNARDYALDAVPQHCMALLLALTNQLLPYHQAIERGDWSKSPQFCLLDYPIRQLRGLNFAVIGYGGLGQATAELARAFGMQVLIAERPDASNIRPGRVSFRQALEQADVLSLHCPATADNHHLLNTTTLGWLKPKALLLNTARGSLIDSAALAKALKNQQLGGAALDVLEQEPPPADHPLLDPTVPNLLLSPHVAWASGQAMQALINQTAENIRAWQQGQLLRCCNMPATTPA